jgi:hypothetical protein
MAKVKEKKQKGEFIMKVYEDFSADFVIDGDDAWLAAGFASGLEDARFVKIVSVAIQAVLQLRDLECGTECEQAPKKKAVKKAAPKKKDAPKKK